MGWLLEQAPDEAEELAEVWLFEPEGPAVVAAVDVANLPKAGKKVLRRLMHRARSQGLELDVPEAKAERKVARLPKIESGIDEAYVAPFDPRGARLVYIVESTPSGGARVFEALLDAERGMVDFQVYRAGRSAVRKFVRDVTGRAQYGAIAAEPSQVRALLARHVERHPSDRPLPRSFDEWRGRLLADADPANSPGEEARKALASASPETADVDQLLARVREGDLGPWPSADRVRLERAAQSLRDAAGELEGDALEAALEAATDDIAAQLYGAEERRQCAERLDETAYLHWRADELPLAAAALKLADELRTAGDVEETHAFTRLASQRLLTPLLEELRAPKEPQEDAAPNTKD